MPGFIQKQQSATRETSLWYEVKVLRRTLGFHTVWIQKLLEDFKFIHLYTQYGAGTQELKMKSHMFFWASRAPKNYWKISSRRVTSCDLHFLKDYLDCSSEAKRGGKVEAERLGGCISFLVLITENILAKTTQICSLTQVRCLPRLKSNGCVPFMYFFKFIYLFWKGVDERGRVREWGQKRIPGRLHTVGTEPMQGLSRPWALSHNPLRLWPELRSRVRD